MSLTAGVMSASNISGTTSTLRGNVTPDEIVNEIFRIQNERDPSSDPGDMTIGIQDDIPLVEVSQDRLGKPFLSFALGIGSTIQEALEHALIAVQEEAK